jgi:hypothetical protein
MLGCVRVVWFACSGQRRGLPAERTDIQELANVRDVVVKCLVTGSRGSAFLIAKPSQFYPPPILTTYFPKIHLTN